MSENTKISILVIDDDAAILGPLSELLSYEGYIVKTASTGDEAFVVLKSTLPDIILLDITMPKMDGFEICKVIKSNNETKHIPVIFLTGAGAGFNMKLQSLMVGAVDYICKPYERDELIEKIKTHLEKTREG